MKLFLLNIWLWLTLRLRLCLRTLLRSNIFLGVDYHWKGYELLDGFIWDGSLWWGEDGGHQIYSPPIESGVLECKHYKGVVDTYFSDNIHTREQMFQPPFKAQIDVEWKQPMVKHSWDAPLWFYGDDPNEIDVVEVYGNKFQPTIHWGSSKKDKHKTHSPLFRLQRGVKIHSFSVDVGYELTKFYYNDILYRVYRKPKRNLLQKYRAICSVGVVPDAPPKDGNTMIIHDLIIGR